MLQTPVAVYVHTPFCPSKCGYCDFNSYAITGDIIERTTAATIAEIQKSPWRGRPAKTIFFGGGTPTFLASEQLTRILKAVMEVHPPTSDCEITSEANPGTVDIPKFAAMIEVGFNRISLGAQSFVPEDLIRLGRVHESTHIVRAVRAAREAGFKNLNLDLMFALPGQTDKAWEKNLELALSLKPNHLSLYCLTIEPNTRFYKAQARGMLHLPDDDIQVRMYETACRMTHEAGLEQYEISNFAHPGLESRHNLCYWHNEEYLSYGPGAVGCFDESEIRTRYTNMKHPERYSDAIEQGTKLWCEHEEIGEESRKLERLMMGLRLNQGVRIPSEDLDLKQLDRMMQRDWIRYQDEVLSLTPAGRHFCSEVIAELS
jgi:oxygen-independent coproporphyrinogen-3 oxidase